MTARLDVIHNGTVTPGVSSTVTLVRSGDAVIVVDPGMVPSRSLILEGLAEVGTQPADVTDIVVSHHHPDHTMNIALFPEDVRVHDHWAIYQRDVWINRPAEGFVLAQGVTLIETPGHTPQDITTLVQTDDGIAALTHLWGFEGAESDGRATDLDALHAGRRRVAEIAQLIVPGHGAPFRVTPDTPL